MILYYTNFLVKMVIYYPDLELFRPIMAISDHFQRTFVQSKFIKKIDTKFKVCYDIIGKFYALNAPPIKKLSA